LKLALGTAQFGMNYGVANMHGQVSQEDVQELLIRASAVGIDTIDTAIGYCESEKRLGEAGVSKYKVVTKLPARTDLGKNIQAGVLSSVKKSLFQLKIKKLWGLLLHRPDDLLCKDGETLYQSLQMLKNEGLVENVGLSIYSPDELDVLCSSYSFDIIQAPFNILDCRLKNSGWLARLSKQGTEIHVRSVFLQGLLLMSQTDQTKKFGRWSEVWKTWHTWLNDSKISPLEACLAFVLKQPEFNKVIVGVDSLSQLNEIIKATKYGCITIPNDFSTEDIDLINPACWKLS